MGELKSKVFQGAFWLTLERAFSQFVDFALGIVLARLLTPSDYGTVALTTIFFVVARSLADCGLGQSLIQKKDADDLDFNSVFYASLVLVSFVYGALFLSAPLIARFFQEPRLVPIVRVSGLTLICFAVNSVQTAEMTRLMRFDLMFRISMIVGLANAIFGISLAFGGFGVWALVLSGVLTAVVNVIVRWFFIAWRPRLAFSLVRVRALVSFGWKVAATELLDNFFRQLSGMLIGKFYTKADLAFVEKGGGLPSRLFFAVESATGAAAYPALVKLQDDPARLLAAARRIARCSFFAIAPLMVFVAICAPEVIFVLFGHQWLPAVPYMRIACCVCSFWPFAFILNKVLLATGRSGTILCINMIGDLLVLVAIGLFMKSSLLVYQIAVGVVGGPVMFLLFAWMNRRSLGYRFSHVLCDVMPTLVLSLIVATVLWSVGLLCDRIMPFVDLRSSTLVTLVRLCFQGAIAGMVYVCVAMLCRIEAMSEILLLLGEYAPSFQKWLPLIRNGVVKS